MSDLYAVNKSASPLPIGDVGRQIKASSERLIEPVLYGKWSKSIASGDALTAINADNLRIKIGSTELSKQGSKDVFNTDFVRTSTNDKDPGLLVNKIYQGPNITVEEIEDGGKKKVKFSGAGGGGISEVLYARYAKSVAENSTTSSSYQTKLSITDTFDEGKYIIHANAMYSHEDTGVQMYIRIRVDSNNYNEMVRELYNYKYADGAYSIYNQMIAEIEFGPGEHTISIQYKSSEDKRMYIKEAYLSVYKTAEAT